MAVDPKYAADAEKVLARRYDLGWDYWTTPDRRLLKGSPFSALDSAMLLLELGMEPAQSPLPEVAGLIFDAWREDGRFKLYPQGQIFPCQTAHAAYALCRMGYARDERLQKTLSHLLDIRHRDGGWRCEKYFFGRGPETEFSNPGPTLTALNAFRLTDFPNREPALDGAVEFLLSHWTTRLPLGPCHYGIGTLFMSPEYPFGNYNLFVYVYVLSFYESARRDARFCEAFDALQSTLADGMVVPRRVNRKLEGLTFCKKGEPSPLATVRWREILENLG